MKKGWKIDSLHSSAEEQGQGSEDEGTEDDSLEGIFDVKRSIIIRAIPRPGKYDLYGAKDVAEFIREYEGYCKEQFHDNKQFWVKELGDFLEGRIADFYRTVMSVREPKYDVVQQRLIEQVCKVKAGVRFRKVNDFDKARMRKN